MLQCPDLFHFQYQKATADNNAREFRLRERPYSWQPDQFIHFPFTSYETYTNDH